jgi:hypothetical protein
LSEANQAIFPLQVKPEGLVELHRGLVGLVHKEHRFGDSLAIEHVEPLGHHDATQVVVLEVGVYRDDVDLTEAVRV